MRTKTANEIRKVLRYLVSPDEELINLGINLFQDCYLLTQIHKNEVFTVEYKWPGFPNDIPPHFRDIPRYSRPLKFTKGQFIKMLNSQTTSIYKKACLILSFVADKVDSWPSTKNRNSNYCLERAIHRYDLNRQLIAKREKLERASHYRLYFDHNKKQTVTSQIQNFEEEICELNISLEHFNYNQYDQITPKQVIDFHKNYLRNNYKSKLRRKWIRNNKNRLSKLFHLPYTDFDLFENFGLSDLFRYYNTNRKFYSRK